MSPVTKDHQRHYAAISAEVEAFQKAPWTCLVCQTVNAGPLSEGCGTCGSGTAGAMKAPPEAPKPVASWQPHARAVVRQAPEQSALAAAARFLQQQPAAGVIDAFLAGYAQASRDVREGVMGRPQDPRDLHGIPAGIPEDGVLTYRPGEYMGIPRPTPSPPEVGSLSPEGKPTRTILAALALFRDQVLVEGPEEIATGEWCSVEDVNGLIAQLTEEQHGYHDASTPDDADRDDLPF